MENLLYLHVQGFNIHRQVIFTIITDVHTHAHYALYNWA